MSVSSTLGPLSSASGPGRRGGLTGQRACRRWLRAWLACLVVVAAVLRLVGLDFGRGVLTPRPDAELVRSGVLISLTGDLNPHYAVWGHLYHYLYLAAWSVWLGLQVLAGQASSWVEAVAACHCRPWAMVLCGRALSATAGLSTVLATYLLARRTLGSRLSAAAAATLLTVLFLHVRDSHFDTADILLTLLCTMSLAALCGRGRQRPGRAGVWLGLALATKLLAVTVLFSYLTVLLAQWLGGADGRDRAGKWTGAIRLLVIAAAVWLAVQPFLVLDPAETWYGLFKDLFRPGRRPFRHGLDLTNAGLIVNYYVPQAMGWSVGGLAVLGGLHLCLRLVLPGCWAWCRLPVSGWRGGGAVFGAAAGRTVSGSGRRVGRLRRLAARIAAARYSVLLLYTFWTLAALVSVQRIFLRYLDPLLPVICVLAADGLALATRALASVSGRVAALTAGSTCWCATAVAWLTPVQYAVYRGGGRWRAVVLAAATALAAIPNLVRCVQLDRCLRRADTRALAGQWLQRHVPSGSRIMWSGYGAITAHLTMPWLHSRVDYDRLRIQARTARGLPTAVDEAVIRWKQRTGVPTYWVVGLHFGPEGPEQSGLVYYPMLDHRYDWWPLERLAGWSRAAGVLTRESPRWELMRRHVCSVVQTRPESLLTGGPSCVVVTGMPCDPAVLAVLKRSYEVAAVFEPGIDWSEYGRRVMYDAGDAWYVPNQGIGRVARPGPQVYILLRRGER